ncbi:MAG: TSUP family transporter [Rhodocyclaceae bacterium]|nr:TSUP family transporter [Rhodocyclaceae bacterium]
MADLSLILLAFAALLAGFVDAVVGGGGLIQIPALFTLVPGAEPATIFGTNKSASVVGTLSATGRYMRQVSVPWRATLYAAFAAVLFSYLGAMVVSWLPRNLLRPLILMLLIGAAGYTFWRKDFGSLHRPAYAGRREMVYALLLGAAIGFYDGFFGPGAGSFLIFLFVRFFGFDFLHASVAAKVVNAATNLAALAYFLPHGQVMVSVAIVMAVCNVIGAQAGAHLALRHGSGFIRGIFLLVVSALILRFAWEIVKV